MPKPSNQPSNLTKSKTHRIVKGLKIKCSTHQRIRNSLHTKKNDPKNVMISLTIEGRSFEGGEACDFPLLLNNSYSFLK